MGEVSELRERERELGERVERRRFFDTCPLCRESTKKKKKHKKASGEKNESPFKGLLRRRWSRRRKVEGRSVLCAALRMAMQEEAFRSMMMMMMTVAAGRREMQIAERGIHASPSRGRLATKSLAVVRTTTFRYNM